MTLQAILPTHMDANNSSYNSQGEICTNKSDLKVDPTVSDATDKISEKKGVMGTVRNQVETKVKSIDQNLKQTKEKNKEKWANNKKIRLKDQKKKMYCSNTSTIF